MAYALVYAIEREIAARRAARDHKWPKTIRLERRQPEKKKAFAALKKRYDRAYQHLRHLHRTGQLHVHALLTTQRMLQEAWMILLDMPAPWQGEEGVIALGAAPEGSNAQSSACDLTGQDAQAPFAVGAPARI